MTAREFGRYRLDRLLGRGSAGEVWLAYDPAEARTVALKILSGSAAEDADYRRRFEREARIGTHLDNPHIAPIHRFGAYAGRLYLDMAYIPGVDLARLVRSSAMAVPEAVDLISQIAEALDAAHAAGMVHRDVKPANIIVHTSGFAYLIDFGIARAAGQSTITATGFTVGTLAYMAPERFTGHGDSRSDVYSLACVLYECLTARRPFGDTDAVRQLHAHLHEPPPRPSAVDGRIPAALDAVVARGMAKRADDRYRTAGELAAAARAAVGMTIADRTPPTLHSEQPTTAQPGPASTTRHVGPTFVATRQDGAAQGYSGPAPTTGDRVSPAPAASGHTGRPPATRKFGSDPAAVAAAGIAADRPPASVRATRMLPDASAPAGPPAARAGHAAAAHHPASVRNARPTLVGSSSFRRENAAAQHISSTPPRRSAVTGAAALIGAAIVALAVVAGCTALLSSGSGAPSEQQSTTRPEATTPAPASEAPATPEYTTAVIPPRRPLPFPTGVLPPPFQIPHAAGYSGNKHDKPTEPGKQHSPHAG
ncbi:serine/threonine-protein kinase [Nocardia africana]|uniref:non-specific serine/threonine protein kinase n=1 Tax=Nocardia africana TaxID=134964 RepID=A0A378WM77_9NOCA|nr:serine/threonine-protein kinase [Nocardia africana]MCC3315655.1 serine/threonine protein kinase [Nocardia africana]SUA42032.1 Probable serine/threonine-protein kinase pknH [Nocardia africana]